MHAMYNHTHRTVYTAQCQLLVPLYSVYNILYDRPTVVYLGLLQCVLQVIIASLCFFMSLPVSKFSYSGRSNSRVSKNRYRVSYLPVACICNVCCSAPPLLNCRSYSRIPWSESRCYYNVQQSITTYSGETNEKIAYNIRSQTMQLSTKCTMQQ